MISCLSSDVKAHEEETTPVLVATVTPALSTNQKVIWGSLFSSRPSANTVHALWMEDHFLAADPMLSLYIRSEWRITFWQQTLCCLCTYALNGGSLFGSGGFGSVQPVNQQAIGGGASGEDRPHLCFVLAFDRSVRCPLKITDRKRRRRVTRVVGPHLSDDVTGVLSLTWWPGELWPSAQALPWKRTSWLRTCCYSSCKLQQTPEEEATLSHHGKCSYNYLK